MREHPAALSHEVWATYEQVFVALLQHARGDGAAGGGAGKKSEHMARAQEYISELAARFPESLRVKRMEGMLWEAKGETELALAEYDECLAQDASNLLATKRQIALCRGRGGAAKLAEAAKRLCEYLATFTSDAEGWLLLHDIYLTCAQYKRAAFCAEELILINPMSYIYHVRAGEVTYTMGMSSSSGSHVRQLRASIPMDLWSIPTLLATLTMLAIIP